MIPGLIQQIPKPMRNFLRELIFSVPEALRKNQIHIGEAGLERIKKSIKKNYHGEAEPNQEYLRPILENDLQEHLTRRLEKDRNRIVPWLDSARPLQGARLLEIGCGTGSATVALAEQGAMVTGIDVDEGALKVARDRCEVYGLEVKFRQLNSANLEGIFTRGQFDTILFFASLEHMTVNERLAALRQAWNLLPKGGLLGVLETPNRLWHLDGHTSFLPFYHWLPNDLAFHYSRFSPRADFKDAFRKYEPATELKFLRKGRGVSFHEFDLALEPAQGLKVVSSLYEFEGFRQWLGQPWADQRYKALLKKMHPSLHHGFFEDYLFLIIEK